MRALPTRLLPLALVALAAACNGTGSSSQTTPTATTALAVCQAATTAQADRRAACQGATPSAQQLWRTSGTAFCQAVAREVAAGRATFDATQAPACQAALAALDCDAAARAGSAPGAGLGVAGCAAAFGGAVPDGDACVDDVDCATGFCTAAWTGTCPGICAPRGASGVSCLDRPCAAGLVCDFTAGGICRTPSAPGGPCPCGADAWCDTGGATPVCRTLQQSGTCPGPWACAPGLACAGSPATCRLPASEGTACLPAVGGCAPGLACDPLSQTCRPAPVVGQSCVVTVGTATATLACQDGWCDAGGTRQCRALGADGQTCRTDVECRGRCDATTLRCVGASGLACAAP